MQRVSFSKNVDGPRLAHMRKMLFSKVLWDESLQIGRLDFAWFGESEISCEYMLSNPSVIVSIEDEMINKGSYIFSFRSPQRPTKFKVVVEKFEIRRRLLGKVFGYRVGIAAPELTDQIDYFVSRSLTDLNTKLFSIFVLEEKHESLSERETITIMSAW